MHRALGGGIRQISDFFKPVRESVYQQQCDKTLDAIKESQRLAAIKLAESTAAKKNRRRFKRNIELRKERVLRKQIQERQQEKNRAVYVLDENGTEHPGALCLIDMDSVLRVLTEEEIEDELAHRASKKRKAWTARPTYWKDILEAFGDATLPLSTPEARCKALQKEYPTEFSSKTPAQIEIILRQWARDVKNNKEVSSKQMGSAPAYGREIDLELAELVRLRRRVGLSMDQYMLQFMLRELLKQKGKESLLKENGGALVAGGSWCDRFYSRHNFTHRVATTKMREAVPADFEAKKESYIEIGSRIIHENNIPKELVIAGDETAVMLVSKAKYTYAEKGSKRVRLIGIGDNDKAQITATVFVTEDGDVLPIQLIFKGKTNACHPSGTAPDGIFWDHTESHWQTPASMIRLIDAVVVPYKNSMIAKLNLPAEQKTMLKLDLHYSHYKEGVPAHMAMHNIIPHFVPGQCTDHMAECDVVVNCPFKGGIKSAYRDFMHNEFAKWCEDHPDRMGEFHGNCKLSYLKPHLTPWVISAGLALKTPEMRETIKKSFANDGCFTEIRRRAAVLTTNAAAATAAAAAAAATATAAAAAVAAATRLDLAQVLADLCLGMGPRRTNTEQDEDEEARMLRDLDLDEEIEENEADDE